MNKCKWCNKEISEDHTEENCNLNDGGKNELDAEYIANKYFD